MMGSKYFRPIIVRIISRICCRISDRIIIRTLLEIKNGVESFFRLLHPSNLNIPAVAVPPAIFGNLV